MNYLQTHNERDKSKHRGLWGGVIVFAVFIFLIQMMAPHFLPAIFTTIARPFWRVEFSISSGSLRSQEYLLNENEALRRQLADITIRLETNQSVVNENDELKALLKRPVTSTSTQGLASSTTVSSSAVLASTGFVDPLFGLKPSPYTLSAVLKRPPLAPYDELIIDIGTYQNVAVGDLVYASGNVLVGRVADTLSDTSKVNLLSSTNTTYDVLIGDSNTSSKNHSVPAVAHGLGGGQFSVQVPRDVVTNIGDIVTVPSINNKTIGIVGGVITDPTQPFETILFTSLANIYDLKWALVDTNTATSTPNIKNSKK